MEKSDLNTQKPKSCKEKKHETSGSSPEQAVESKRFTLQTKERYATHPIKGHRLILEIWCKDNQTGEEIRVSKHEHKLSKHTPKWLTTNNLWNHNEGEITQLRNLMTLSKEKTPSKETLKTWKESLQLDKLKNVSQTDNTKKH